MAAESGTLRLELAHALEGSLRVVASDASDSESLLVLPRRRGRRASRSKLCTKSSSSEVADLQWCSSTEPRLLDSGRRRRRR